ncbi:hypothetical protein V1525DRAFT_393190 [Lipomyces kononenkoae]|uniref:Uncharacterized protein n=1 Tax=Lipomyces kononenkoae TaxID=34357 RepID=A0ACC3TC28_LIPKO
MPVLLTNVLHTPPRQSRGRVRRRDRASQQEFMSAGARADDLSPTLTYASTTASHSQSKAGPRFYSMTPWSLSEILHRLNPRYLFVHGRDMPHSDDAIQNKTQAALEAGVIYGTRTYDWGTPTPSVKSPTSATFKNTPSEAGASMRRGTTIRRIIQASKSVLRTKLSSTTTSPVRVRTHIEVANDSSPVMADVADRDALGILMPQSASLGVPLRTDSSTETETETETETDTRRRFSFDSSTNGSLLLRNDSAASKVTEISIIDAPMSVGQDKHENDDPDEQIVVPFPAKFYSAAELADITAFDFSDDAYDDGFDDMLIDEVNAYGAEVDGFFNPDDSDLEREISHASLTPISEQADEDGTPGQSPVLSSPRSGQSRQVVAYVRGSRGWVVERRMRKGGWPSPDSSNIQINPEIEEELVATERVERRAI